jgi:hypothetical protein
MSASDTIFLGKVYDVIDTDPGKINDYWISPAKMKRFTRRTMRNSAKFLPYDPTKPEYFLIPILLDIAEKSGCDGLFNSSLRSRPAEIILKNPINSLIRYYPDKNDWQHVDANKAFSQLGGMTEFQQLVNDMFSYITTNVDFHAGDLYSHSIWVALYTQSWITNTTNKWNIIRETFLQKFQNYENIKDRIFKMTLLAAFLHDIGKMGGKKIFYDKPDHPNIGYEYLASPKLTLENGNVLDPTILFDKFKDKFGFSDEEEKFMILFVMGIVKNHWSFGDHVRLINSGENVKTAGEKYIRLIKTWWNDKAGVFKDNFLLFQIFIVSLMIVSACDILGSEVYINDDSYKQIADMIKQNKAYENQTIDINAKLDELGLPNMYKTHHGGDSFNKFKIDTAGYNLFVQVSKLL